MKNITTKQEQFLNLIINFYKVNKVLPTIKDLKNITKYKSYNSIYKYINTLENKNYIKYDYKRKQIIFINQTIKDNNLISIPFKDQDSYLNIFNSNNYQVIKVHNNNLNSFGIYKDDMLIISNDLSYLNNKFVGIKDEYTFKIFKYTKKNGFHHLINDKEELVFANTNIIIFKVVSLIRKM